MRVVALYNYIADQHLYAEEKPDRVFSHLPTVLSIAKPEKKIVVDVGCGAGFFTRPFAQTANKVYGIDCSIEQIERAKHMPRGNIEYNLADMRTWHYPECDIICVPYILNTINPVELLNLLKRMHHSLKPEGELISIVDMPKAVVHDNREFGSRKLVHSSHLATESKMDIELYTGKKKFLTLHAAYYPRHVFEQAAVFAGFRSFRWHGPLVAAAGIEKHGRNYWKRYLARPDVAYFSATK